MQPAATPTSCTQHSPWPCRCLQRICPAPHMASRAAWCCCSCCCCFQGADMMTCDACTAAEQPWPVLLLLQHLHRNWCPAASGSALPATCPPHALLHSLARYYPTDSCLVACRPADRAHASLPALIVRSWAPAVGSCHRARMANVRHSNYVETIETLHLRCLERAEMAGA